MLTLWTKTFVFGGKLFFFYYCWVSLSTGPKMLITAHYLHIDAYYHYAQLRTNCSQSNVPLVRLKAVFWFIFVGGGVCSCKSSLKCRKPQVFVRVVQWRNNWLLEAGFRCYHLIIINTRNKTLNPRGLNSDLTRERQWVIQRFHKKDRNEKKRREKWTLNRPLKIIHKL